MKFDLKTLMQRNVEIIVELRDHAKSSSDFILSFLWAIYSN